MKKYILSLLSFFQRHRRGILLSFLTGVCTGTSYVPFTPWAILFNYAPLWWYWLQPETHRREIFWSGWFSQFVFNLIGFFWVYHTAHEFGHFPAILSLLALLLFASLAHLFVPLCGLLFYELKKRSSSSSASSPSSSTSSGTLHGLWPLLFLAAFWGLCEIFWPYLFQWHMGYSLLSAQWPAFHWADVIGFQGLSFVLLLFNVFFVWWFQRPHRNRLLHGAIGGLGALVLFILLNLLGWFHGQHWLHTRGPEKTLQFLPVQANIGNAEKIMAERGLGFQSFILKRFLDLSRQGLQKFPQADFLVWPESAIPDNLDPAFAQRPRPREIKNFLMETKKFLITGAYSTETLPQGQSASYNALFFFNDQGDPLLTSPYRKKHLLAFGEYTPLAQWFPKLNEISPAGKGFDRGPGPQSLTILGPQGLPLRVAPQICYEALYPDFARQGALAGAQIFINVTNDSWFGPVSEPYQHQVMTFARAIENRRPLLRVTNTGFTSAIEASGKWHRQSPLYSEWTELIPLGYQESPPLTVYTRFGALWPWFILLWTVTTALLALKRKSARSQG